MPALRWRFRSPPSGWVPERLKLFPGSSSPPSAAHRLPISLPLPLLLMGGTIPTIQTHLHLREICKRNSETGKKECGIKKSQLSSMMVWPSDPTLMASCICCTSILIVYAGSLRIQIMILSSFKINFEN